MPGFSYRYGPNATTLTGLTPRATRRNGLGGAEGSSQDPSETSSNTQQPTNFRDCGARLAQPWARPAASEKRHEGMFSGRGTRLAGEGAFQKPPQKHQGIQTSRRRSRLRSSPRPSWARSAASEALGKERFGEGPRSRGGVFSRPLRNISYAEQPRRTEAAELASPVMGEVRSLGSAREGTVWGGAPLAGRGLLKTPQKHQVTPSSRRTSETAGLASPSLGRGPQPRRNGGVRVTSRKPERRRGRSHRRLQAPP